MPEITDYNFYVDDGFSGTTFERPDFKKLIHDIHCGLIIGIIAVVVVAAVVVAVIVINKRKNKK